MFGFPASFPSAVMGFTLRCTPHIRLAKKVVSSARLDGSFSDASGLDASFYVAMPSLVARPPHTCRVVYEATSSACAPLGAFCLHVCRYAVVWIFVHMPKTIVRPWHHRGTSLASELCSISSRGRTRILAGSRSHRGNPRLQTRQRALLSGSSQNNTWA